MPIEHGSHPPCLVNAVHENRVSDRPFETARPETGSQADSEPTLRRGPRQLTARQRIRPGSLRPPLWRAGSSGWSLCQRPATVTARVLECPLGRGPGQLQASAASAGSLPVVNTLFERGRWDVLARWDRIPLSESRQMTCRPAGPSLSSVPSVCADGRAGQLGWPGEYKSHRLPTN